MRVSDLRELLENYPDDMEIKVTWEGITRYIDEESLYAGYDFGTAGFSVEKKDERLERLEDKTPVLYIDADENFYKDHFKLEEDD